MKNQQQTIDNLMDEMLDYLRKSHRHPVTIDAYRYSWQKVRSFMLAKKIKYYNVKTERAFLNSVLGDYDYSKLNKREKGLVNRTEALCEFQKTGRILLGCRKHPPKEFKGETGRTITDFIAYRKNRLKLAKRTVHQYAIYLYPFNCYMNSIGIKHISDIKAPDILFYIKQMDLNTSAKRYCSLLTFRIFFRHLYEQCILPVDYSRTIPKGNYKKQPKLPSTFTDREIEDLLKAIDRASPKGKRDYAMLLLATKLGLRASDICGLKFENIIWKQNKILLEQYKTGTLLELPLLPEVGNAIIDYLKHGRPVSQDSNCFLRAHAPYQRMHSTNLGSIVGRYMRQAGINCTMRKHGSHALRHSFASALLKDKVPLPVISEVLGHKNMDSSMFYLRIDISSLRACALEVPMVPLSFYQQKGGGSHE